MVNVFRSISLHICQDKKNSIADYEYMNMITRAIGYRLRDVIEKVTPPSSLVASFRLRKAHLYYSKRGPSIV